MLAEPPNPAAGHGDRLDATGHDDVGAVVLDVVGGQGDGVEARRAVALDRGAARRDGQAGEQAGEAGEVAGAVGAVAEVDVLDGFGLDARLRHRVADGVGRHGHRWGDVEPAPTRLGESGAGVADDHGFTHGATLGRSEAVTSKPSGNAGVRQGLRIFGRVTQPPAFLGRPRVIRDAFSAEVRQAADRSRRISREPRCSPNCKPGRSLASNGLRSDDPPVLGDDELRRERAYLDAAYDRVLAMRGSAERMAGTARLTETRSAQALFERDSAIAHAGHRLAALDIAKDRLLVGSPRPRRRQLPLRRSRRRR